MTSSYNQISESTQAKLELLGIDTEVKYLIENLATITNAQEELSKLLAKPAMSTASLRAPEGYHLPNIMLSLEPELLDKFGGHPCAAGFSARTEVLPNVKQGFVEYLREGDQGSVDMSSYQEGIPKALLEQMSPSMKATLDKNVIYLDYKDLNLDLLAEVFRLEPFGIDFPFPYFLFSLPNNYLTIRKIMGQESKHIKLTMSNGLNVTFFNLQPDLVRELNDTDKELIILAKLSQNTWNNNTKLELIGEGACLN